MVEQLGLCTFTAEGLASVCGRRTKILQASQQGKKKKKKPKQERKERQRQSKGPETHHGGRLRGQEGVSQGWTTVGFRESGGGCGLKGRQAGVHRAPRAVGEDFRGVGGESCSLAALERN